MSHVFISYVHENQEMAERLREDLISHNIDVWFDRDSILPGMRWKDAIRQAINNGAYFIACFSTEYENRQKSYMNEELMLAIDELRQYSTERPWFIPVLFSECHVPAISIGGGQTLLDFQWVDLYTDWDSGFQRLLKILKVDEIKEIKDIIDELGYIYTRRASGHTGGEEKYKYGYLERVHELKKKYGVWYDPIKLDRA